ncbi:MAG TPA: ATP-binding cassette domain-containing protein [Solirubrobacterales bacterium]|jgi:sulfate-transporting ATPase|nr:ATP-binding cassette domain-containing protein [Solirubrobacterales bacterium]
MSEVIQFAILGLSSGALLALFAMGLVVVYRGSAVVNFAHGAIGMVGTYVFWALSANDGWAYLPAFAVGVLACAAIGLLTHLLIMHPLRGAAPVTRMIATLGLLTVLEQGMSHIVSPTSKIVNGALPTSTVHILGATVGVDKLILFGISLVLVAALSAFYRYTKFGWATTAANENRVALAALGYSQSKLAAISWVLGTAIAGVAGILLAPTIGLQVTQLTLLILPGLAAAVVGNLRSFSLTLVGGLAIGIIQSEISRYVSTPGWSDTAPFILILIVLLVRGQDRGLRTQIAERMPKLGTGRIRLGLVLPAVVAMIVIVNLNISASWMEAIVTTFGFAVILLSFVPVTGYSGQLSLAQYAFAGWGAWIAGRLYATTGTPFILVIVIAVLATVPLGILLGAICLRTRGIYLAIATLGLAVTLQNLIFDSASLTGGTTGTIIPDPKLFGLDIGAILHGDRYAIFCIVVFALAAIAVANLRRGRSGRRLLATRANERAAASLGINPMVARLYAFGLSSGIAAVGGVLITFRNPAIVYTEFETLASIQLVAQAVVGGIGWIIGPVLGALGQLGGVISLLLNPLGGNVTSYLPLAFGVLLLITITQAPDGAAELVAGQVAWVRDKVLPGGRLRRRTRGGGEEPSGASGPTAVPDREERREPVRATKVPALPLVAQGVGVQFGGVRVLTDVSLTVAPGEVVGLIGPNGAGKTTTIDVLSGFVRPREGSVRLGDTELVGKSPSRVARAGLARSFQSLELFDDMTVRDNLRTAAEPRDALAFLSDLFWPRRRPLGATVDAVIAEFELEPWLDHLPTDLPYGRRRLVAIARAVASEPSVLCLDEPAAGLDEAERKELAEVVTRLAAEWGMGVLLIEHDTDLVLGVCDRVCVLNFGQVLASGTPEQIRANPEVIAAYLGGGDEEAEGPATSPRPGAPARPAAPPQPATAAGPPGGGEPLRAVDRPPAANGSDSDAEPLSTSNGSGTPTGTAARSETLISTEGLTVGYNAQPAVRDLDLEVGRGEVVALIGANGAGKSTTLMALAGELRPLSGKVTWRGSDARSPLHRRATQGLRYITEERSVFMSMTVEQNLALGRGEPERCYELFPELSELRNRRVGLLSGGEQQMLTLGRALSGGADFLLADELSLGLAPLVSERLLRAVREAADDGLGVVLVEQHVRQALAVADRVYVLQRGRVVLTGSAEEMGGQLERIEASYLTGSIA